MAELHTNSPINQQPCSRAQVFNPMPAWNEVSGAPDLGHMVHSKEMGMGFWYARSTGGTWNGAWQDFHLSGNTNNMQTADSENCNGVTVVDSVGEYPWRVGEYGTEQLSLDYRWRTGVVSGAETEFSAQPPSQGPVNSTAGASSANISLGTNPGDDNAWSCRDVQECHRRDDICNRCQTGELVAHGICISHPRGSEHQYWRAGKLMEYPPCFICYPNIESKTIKQWPTPTLFMEFWDFWWVQSVQDKNWSRVSHSDQCKNWIQTLSHRNAGIPFTLWLPFLDDVADFRCAWGSRAWCCEGKARHRGTVFRREAFDAWHPDWRPWCSKGCGAPGDPNCKVLDHQEVVSIDTREWDTTCSDTEGECTPCWSRMHWGRPS